MAIRIVRAGVLPILLLAACSDHGSASAYVPGLGEIMALQQMRHAKLWFAGDAANWELAAYETDELDEGFADAVTFHPQHKDSPVPLTQAIPQFTARPITALREAIAARDAAKFAAAFDGLTAGCNECHTATKFACNVVVRPQANAFANQDFTAHGK